MGDVMVCFVVTIACAVLIALHGAWVEHVTPAERECPNKVCEIDLGER